MTNINTLLDKADRVYHQLMGHRPQLENLLCKVNEAAPEKPQVTGDRWSLPRPPGWDTLALTLPKAPLASDAALQLLVLCGASIWDSSLLSPVPGRVRQQWRDQFYLSQCEQVHPAVSPGVLWGLQELLR